MQTKADDALSLANDFLESQKEETLSIAIVLSKSKNIVEHFKANRREALFYELNQQLQLLEENTKYQSIEAQIATQDLSSYIRSWDLGSYGEDLRFRKGLIKTKKSLEPTVSIELGKRLNIKAIVPIAENGKFLGTLEIITGFEKISDKLAVRSVDFFVLLDEKFLDIALWMQDREKIGNFVLVNKGCQGECYHSLKSLIHATQEIQNFRLFDTRVFAFLPLFSFDKRIGYMGISFQTEYSDISVEPTLSSGSPIIRTKTKVTIQ